MAKNRRQSNRGRSTKQVQAVYQVDAADASDQIRISRTLSSMDSSLSLINTVIESTSYINTDSTRVTSGSISFPNFTSSTDYSPFATEYKLFRIKAIQFEVYDTASAGLGISFFSTNHVAAGGSLNPTLSTVTAPIDSGIVPAGVGVKTWTWVAKTNDELSWQACNGTIQDYGGLVFYTPQSTVSTTARYTVIAKAIVQFRARV
jgi:hypothetical protein